MEAGNFNTSCTDSSDHLFHGQLSSLPEPVRERFGDKGKRMVEMAENNGDGSFCCYNKPRFMNGVESPN